NAAEILEELATRNYFTVQHADSFEYHPLFRDFLLNRLSTQIEPDKLSNLQQKAAQLLFDYGMIEDAIEVLLVAGAWQTLIPMLLQQAATLTNQGRAQALQRWIGAIPIKAREQEPWLYYWLGISNIASNTAEARTNLQRAHVSFTSCQDRSGMLLAWAGIVETLILEFDDLSRLETWISWLDEDLRQRPEFPTPAIELRVVASMTVAKLFCREDDAEIQPWIEKAEASLELIPDLSARCRLTTYLALHATWKGDIGRLAMLTDWIKQWSEILSANDREGIDVQYALYCRTLYEWAAGIDRFGCDAGTLALSHVARSGIHVLEHHLLARCLTAYLCLGNLVNARKLLHQLHTLTVHGNARPRMHVFQYHNLPGWISLLEGHYQQALYEAQESLEISQTKGATVFHRASSHLVAGHALALTQHMAEAQVHVEQAMSLAKTFGSTLMEYSALLLQAYVKGEGEDNSSYLQSAFALGRQYTYLNTLVWVPELMAELCCRALANNIETDYVRTFITTRHIEPAQPPLHLENWPWPLRIYTLGRFSIHSGGRNLVSTLGKGHKKPLELIQTLIALGGRQVGVAHLIEQLWPDAEGDAAMNLFKITLHRLRKLLSYEDTIEFAEGRLSLNPKKVWVDCWALSRILAEKHGDDAVNRVLDLYHGHFLALEPANNSALVSFRDQLRGRVLKTLKSQIQRAEKQDDWKKVIDYSARGLELDDLDEDFYGALIRAYLAKGRQAEALRVLERAEVR
ncbi:MAG: hypothetical protein OEX00_09905, partial [Gammaproteobacteria bacterium]|nr:hypothetical protein [Gammaproteobacteria bacterium]